jgi:hypothetical protein
MPPITFLTLLSAPLYTWLALAAVVILALGLLSALVQRLRGGVSHLFYRTW